MSKLTDKNDQITILDKFYAKNWELLMRIKTILIAFFSNH